MADDSGIEIGESLLDAVEANPRAARELAAAGLARRVLAALHEALDRSGRSARELAAELGVTESAVSQVLNGDGNLRVHTLGRYLRALDVEAQLKVVPVGTADGEARHRKRPEPEPATADAKLGRPSEFAWVLHPSKSSWTEASRVWATGTPGDTTFPFKAWLAHAAAEPEYDKVLASGT